MVFKEVAEEDDMDSPHKRKMEPHKGPTEKRAKKSASGSGFFDLGSFVAKVRAQDTSIADELAWFSERAQAFEDTKLTMDVVREFLQMCDCDLDQLLVYVDTFREDEHALLQVILALDHIFMRFQEQDDETPAVANVRSKVVIQAQRILAQRGQQLTTMLSDGADPVIMKPILKLLTSMVLVGPEVADVFVHSLDLSFFNGCFTRVRIRETVSIRTCAQYLLIALLVTSKRATLWRLLEQPGLFPWAFAGLVHDRPTDVVSFLETIQERVVDNSSLSKTIKMGVLNRTTLTPVMSLLIWRGQLEWRGKEWSRVFLYTKKGKGVDTATLMKGNELIMATPAEQESVRTTAAKFLAKVFFNTKQGISFSDPRVGLSESNCNSLVTHVVTRCPQIFSETEGADFVADLLVALPDQIKYIIVDRYFNFRTPKLTRTHCNFYHALAKVVKRLDFNHLVAQLEPSSADQYIDLVKHFCFFMFLPSQLTDLSLTSIYSVLDLLNATLTKLVACMNTLSRETRRILVPVIKNHLVPPSDLASLMKLHFNAEQMSTMTEFTGADISDFTLKLLDTINLMSSPVLGYISATIGWDLLADVDGFIQGKVSVIKKSKIYLRLIGIILSFLPNFEDELVRTDMKPMRLLFGLLAEACTDCSFQVELLSHTIEILKKFPRLAKHSSELELWISTILASEDSELNHSYSMVLCDALRDTIVKGDALEKEIQELMKREGSQVTLEPIHCFSPISASMAALDTNTYPLLTAVMREILHRQINYKAYITFLHKYGRDRLDTHFAHYVHFLLKGEKPFVDKSSLSVAKYSSEMAMQLENAFVASMTGGHLKSLERTLAKIKFTDEDAVNVSLLNQLVFIIRWCQDHGQELFVNPVATCLNALASACDALTISRLADFMTSDVILKRFCSKDDLELTLMAMTVVRRVLQHRLDVGFDVVEFKNRALTAVLSGVVDVPPFIETFDGLCDAEDVTSLIEYVCRTGKARQCILPLMGLLLDKHCRLSVETVTHLVQWVHRDDKMRLAVAAFLSRSSMHAAAVDVHTLHRLVEAEAPIALAVLEANPCFVHAVEKKLRSIGDLRGANCVFSLKLLRIIAQENTESPSKETSMFINRSLLLNIKQCFEEDISPDREEEIITLVQYLLDHLRHVVSIFSKDYAKLLKVVLSHVDKPNLMLLIALNAILEFADYSEDALIATYKCLTKLSAATSLAETYITRTCSNLERLPELAWTSPWLKENFDKVLRGVLKRGFTQNGVLLRVLRVLCEKAYLTAKPELSALEATEMVFGHSKFLPTLTGSDSPLKRELVQLLISLTRLDGPGVCKTPHLPILLSGYNASLSLSDQHLFHLMTLYESNGANLAPFRPLVWGEAAPSFYSIDKGTAGVSVLKSATMNQALSQISQQRLRNSVERMPCASLTLDPAVVVEVQDGADIYDPRFVNTGLLHLLDELSEMQIIRLVEERTPLLAVATLAAECSDLRALGYTVLSRIYRKMERVSSHPVVMYMLAILDSLRNSLGSEGAQKLNSITVGYLIRSCEVVISDPSNPLYNQLIRSTLARPAFNVHRLPPLFTRYISSSMAPRERRIWIETLLKDFVRGPRDLELLYSQGLLDNIMMFAQSPLCDDEELAVVLRMVRSWVVRGRIKRYNLVVFWLSQLVRRTDLKSSFLVSILELVSSLSQRLSSHAIRERDLLLPHELINLHIQLVQLISEVTPATLRTLAESFSRALRLNVSPNDLQVSSISEHTIFTLIEMLKEVRGQVASGRADKRANHPQPTTDDSASSAAAMSLEDMPTIEKHVVAVLQKWTPQDSVWTNSHMQELSIDQLWLDSVELIFSSDGTRSGASEHGHGGSNRSSSNNNNNNNKSGSDSTEAPAADTVVQWSICSLEMLHRSLTRLTRLGRQLAKSRALHAVCAAMARCTDAAPLLIIELFDLLKSAGALPRLSSPAYVDAANKLKPLSDEMQAGGFTALVAEAWLSIEKPRLPSLLH